ncbi:SRPBCC family protein [Terrabacter sp. NPDC080008]|uniref:SRPBCC family protein n=1 Tax=Terrabacter sp. NPDC080008 TaxID=3155176 RepID=UPI00344B28BE
MTELTEVLGRVERAGDQVAVVFDRHYATSPEDLWEACTDPDRLARWFAPVSGDLREGGDFTIHFDASDTPQCRVRTCSPPKRLVWEWPVGDAATLVSAEITPDADGARLVLRHERLTPPQAAGYAAGWDTYVRRLEADLSGVPLPDWDQTWTALHARYAATS